MLGGPQYHQIFTLCLAKYHELMPIAQLNRITLHIILAPPDEVYMATYFTKPGP